jgi:type II secretory pathway predicted ATPase ExeA
MYLHHFSLKQPPFNITPDPNFFFTGNKRGEILDALIYAITHGEGIIKVTGEVGCGKTMLCRMLESKLPANVEIIYLINPTLTKDQIIYAIADELKLSIHGKRVDEVIRMLHAALINKHACGKQVVLLVEDAQAMSLSTLEEIRLFSNLETAQHKLLQIVLFGQPELDEHLSVAAIRQLKERITHSFKVPPLNSATIPEYLMFRLYAAGYRGSNLFTHEAVRLIDKFSKGVIRRISILADKSLLAAYADNSTIVQSKHVQAAIRDSEFTRPALSLANWKTVTAGITLFLLLEETLDWHFYRPDSQPQFKPVAATTPVIQQVTPQPAQTLLVNHASETNPTPLQTTSSLLEQRLQLTDAWLKAQPLNQFSLQIALIATRNQDEVIQFLHDLKTKTRMQNIYVYVNRKPATPRFGIVLGSYATHAEATNMLHQLSEQWGYQAQLRTFRGIQREISAN